MRRTRRKLRQIPIFTNLRESVTTGGESKRCGHPDESFTEGHVFQNRLIGKTSDLLKQGATDEKRLIAVNDTAASAPNVVEERNEFEPPIAAGKLMHEPAGLDRLL